GIALLSAAVFISPGAAAVMMYCVLEFTVDTNEQIVGPVKLDGIRVVGRLAATGLAEVPTASARGSPGAVGRVDSVQVPGGIVSKRSLASGFHAPVCDAAERVALYDSRRVFWYMAGFGSFAGLPVCRTSVSTRVCQPLFLYSPLPVIPGRFGTNVR